ncbi:hypothetical protein [Xanthomonas albilineans]|uniref:hypothetical protein n=1 Tax=Xanthomonas albilineans TaxID=29447 RepID=UPI0012D4256F|nr:hypothetical protein [Xanthomonas albilineans]
MGSIPIARSNRCNGFGKTDRSAIIGALRNMRVIAIFRALRLEYVNLCAVTDAGALSAYSGYKK